MKPVKQSKLHCADGAHRGNCYAAALASLLEIPLWMVPPFEAMENTWRSRTDEWLAACFGLKLIDTNGHQVDKLPEFYIASGLSPRCVKHSVVYSAGALVHDPHPSDAGIASVEWTWHLESVA